MERKEAIEVVKKNYPHCAESGTQFETALRTLIPELQESEDEKISKEIINFIATTPKQRNSHPKWIAWLEKQGGHHESAKEYTFNAIPRLLEMIQPTDRAKSYCQKLIDSLEQEGYSTDAKIVRERLKLMNGDNVAMATMDEQKPTVYIPNFRVGDLVISTKNHHLTYKVLEVGHINENGEPEYKVEIFVDGESAHPSNIKYIRIQMMDEWGSLIGQPTAWSEEDEIRLQDALWCVKQATRVARGENDMGTCWAAENWLKDLRLRHHLEPSEWSEEDEVKINRIVACLDNLNVPDYDILLKDVAWLKSLKHQPHWKPSDEQMADLWNMVCECRPADQQLLQDIYYGLKTLKEE